MASDALEFDYLVSVAPDLVDVGHVVCTIAHWRVSEPWVGIFVVP